MPLLPLPPETTLSGGDLPVSDKTDVLAEFPRPQRNAETAPVRDAFAEGFADSFVEYQSKAEEAAAQTDPLRATGIYLQSQAAERGVVPGRSESEADLRARIFVAPDVVTPEAVTDAVDAIITPLTCYVTELELDGWFIHAASGIWDSFVGAEPDYPDRYYDELGNNFPGGAVPSNGIPRSFHIRTPRLGNDGAAGYIGFVATGTDTSTDFEGFFVGIEAYIFIDPKTSNDLYAAIVARVQAIKGQGMSWSLYEDLSL